MTRRGLVCLAIVFSVGACGGDDEDGADELGGIEPGDDAPDDDGGPMMGEDPLGAVAAHNQVRADAQPSPSPALPDVVWDAGIADVAQAWADRCVFEHSVSDFGENLFIGSGTPDANAAIGAWADEAADYDYDSNGCSGVCGHYTQIVWRDTRRIGCAFTDCDSVEGVSFSGRLWVCNYDPPGNYVGERPY